MQARNKTALSRGAFLALGALLGATLVWTLTGAGELGQGVGRGVLDTPKDSIALSGNLTQIVSPGVFVPLDLSITNLNTSSLVITELNVTVTDVAAPNASATLPCTSADFDVRPVDTQFTILVPSQSTRTLSHLGIPQTAWPEVGMPVNTTTDQDGCKGATLMLSYTASGRPSS